MKITGAHWSGGELHLKTSDPEAVRFAMGFKEGDYTLQKARKPRSLDANGLAWTLIDKIAEACRLGKDEVYRNTIRDVGGNTSFPLVRLDAYDELRRTWEAKGLGWQCELMPSQVPGYVTACLTYGSSAFDTKQMSVFIDRLIQDCQALEIPTPADERIESLLEAWDGKQ
jgi:hypothetical protein